MSKKNILIKDATIIPMTDEKSKIEKGYIYIKNNVIEDVGQGNPQIKDSSNIEIIDGQGKVVIPGLINGHTHTPMSILRGYSDDLPLMKWLQNVWAVEARMTPEDMYWGSMLSMAEMMKSGTTTFSDMYYGMEKIASGVTDTGMRALLTQGLIEDETDQASNKKNLAESVDFAKKWNNEANGRITTLLSPHAPYTCSVDFIEKIIDKANELDCSIHMHLAETRDEINTIKDKYGDPPIKLMEKIGLFSRHVIAAHCIYLTNEEKNILKKYKVGVIHNPKSNMKLASGIAPIKTFLDNDILVGIGTDGASSNNTLDMLEEMRFASLLQKVHLENPVALNSYNTLEMGTILGAKALGIDEQVGTIEIGKKADLTILNLQKCNTYPINDVYSHLIYAARAENVEYTIVDGKILLNKGVLTTIDEEKIFWHIDRIKNKLLK